MQPFRFVADFTIWSFASEEGCHTRIGQGQTFLAPTERSGNGVWLAMMAWTANFGEELPNEVEQLPTPLGDALLTL